MRDWRALTPEQHLAAGAALALFVTMLLPWYQQNAVVSAARAAPLQSRNLNAFQVFTFVEAAVLLVAIAVGYLLYARAEGHEFRLPGSDGAVVMAAGLWTALLLIFRLFDKPGISHHGIAANVGVQWGIFFALAAAGLMAYAGSRMRAERRPEPPLERERRRPARPPAPSESRTERKPRSRSAAARPLRPPAPSSGERPRERSGGASRQPVAAVKPTEQLSPAEQLSFEDPPHDPA